jgi:hypothetical protein
VLVGSGAGRVYVRATTKTRRVRRVRFDDATAAALASWKAARARERLAFGPAYKSHGGLGIEAPWLVTEPDGAVVHPDTLGRRFAAIVKTAGVTPITAALRTPHLRGAGARGGRSAGRGEPSTRPRDDCDDGQHLYARQRRRGGGGSGQAGSDLGRGMVMREGWRRWREREREAVERRRAENEAWRQRREDEVREWAKKLPDDDMPPEPPEEDKPLAGWGLGSLGQPATRFGRESAARQREAKRAKAARAQRFQLGESEPTRPGEVRVVRYKGERALQEGLQRMLDAGWEVDHQASSKAMYSLATGIFTSKQIHTVTYRSPEE